MFVLLFVVFVLVVVNVIVVSVCCLLSIVCCLLSVVSCCLLLVEQHTYYIAQVYWGALEPLKANMCVRATEGELLCMRAIELKIAIP